MKQVTSEDILLFLKTLPEPYFEHQGISFEISYSLGYECVYVGYDDFPYLLMLDDASLSDTVINAFNDYRLMHIITEVLNED